MINIDELQRRSLKQIGIAPEFDSIGISVASPEQIRSWSYGEVKKPETINYRTFKPERDGLFCSRIFGPIKDYECLCGKYKRMKYKGIICEKCGVEVTLSKVRRDRMGHIELASPVAHIWFTKSLPSRIGILLDLPLKDIDRILYFENYIILDPGSTNFKTYQLISEEEYFKAQDDYGEDSFIADMGAEALKIMLENLNPENESRLLREELKDVSSEIRRKKIIKRLKLMESFLDSKTKPSYLILDVIPVIPPELRPLVPLDGGRFATSDLNDLYRRVINRNNRLRRLIELRAPDIIIRNEKRMLQEAVDALFDNGRRGKSISGANKRPLKSLSDMLKGKQGRFRQNLLGKRVDYSGRSVIVVGPELKLHQCGIPKRMALELFKPFVYAKLEKKGLATTLRAAKRLVEKERPEVWDILEEVIREHPVLLNRAPTLHRLGIQAFEPILIEGKAIQLHPLVCAAFNADFDGDQMAVHIPLSLESQLEARVLMMSTNNILSPANGRPIVVPSKDIVLGLYYLSLACDNMPGEGMKFSNLSEIEYALFEKKVHLHTKIQARVQIFGENDSISFKRLITTPGRMIIGQHLPKHSKLQYELLINQELTSKEIANLVDLVYRYTGQKETVVFVDKIMSLGFRYATYSAISFGKDDLIVPENKVKFIKKTKNQVAEYEQQYLDGLITQGEKYNKIVDAWSQCTDQVAEAMMEAMSKPKSNGELNSIHMMAQSGARGSAAQMKQLSGMRGLMAKPSGDIIETPILSNFKEGLNVLEYFISTHGARKGLSDTALKTANAGYLTRRLVDVAQDCIITEYDCGTKSGLTLQISNFNTYEVISPSFLERAVGRVSSKDIVDDKGVIIIKSGEMIDEVNIQDIDRLGIEKVKIRSVLTCESKSGVCVNCYGRDLARGSFVNIGEAVGVIAAQSIGEPGTQLTMRTFHIGGAAQRGAEQSSIEAYFESRVSIRNSNIATNSSGQKVILGRNSELVLIDSNNREKTRYRLPYGSFLLVEDGDYVKQSQKLVEWDPYTLPIVSEADGIAYYVDLIEGISMREIADESTGLSSRVVVDWKQQSRGSDLKPMIVIRDKEDNPIILPNGIEARYLLPVDAILSLENGSFIKSGDVIARVPREVSKSRDITGGLPRVSELFEARKPKDSAIMAEFDGYIEFGKDYKSKRKIIIHPTPSEDVQLLQSIEYFVPKGRHILIQEGDNVKKGDMLVDGNIVLHDILRILGIEALATYLLNEVQQVYRLQGVRINDKHIEVIIRQMLRKYEITDPGDTSFILGEYVDQYEFEEVNNRLKAKGQKPANGIIVLQGITKASLQTKSFISSASFQETTRVLTEASISCKKDNLLGLKENVIVGRLIPAGTGRFINKLKKISRIENFDEILN